MVLAMIHGAAVYNDYGLQRPQNPCGTQPPRYPHRLELRDPSNPSQLLIGRPLGFPFITGDSTAQIVNFYYQSDLSYLPAHANIIAPSDREHFFMISNSKRGLEDLNRSIVVFNIVEDMSLRTLRPACGKLFLAIHDYGFFRVATLFYMKINWDPAR